MFLYEHVEAFFLKPFFVWKKVSCVIINLKKNYHKYIKFRIKIKSKIQGYKKRILNACKKYCKIAQLQNTINALRGSVPAPYFTPG